MLSRLGVLLGRRRKRRKTEGKGKYEGRRGGKSVKKLYLRLSSKEEEKVGFRPHLFLSSGKDCGDLVDQDR